MQENKGNHVEEEFLEPEVEGQEPIEGELPQEGQEETVDEGNVSEPENKMQEGEQRLLRLQADFDNYKKRVTKEKEDIYKYASEGTVKALLPVVDNFERALDSIKETEEDQDGYIQGMDMVYQQLIQVLNKEGVEEVPALGEIFDPNLHHAVVQEENEEYEDNCIIEVFQKGYMLKSKVIRPSMVKVCIHS